MIGAVLTAVLLAGFVSTAVARRRIRSVAYPALLALLALQIGFTAIGRLQGALAFAATASAGLLTATCLLDAALAAARWYRTARARTPMRLAPPFYGTWMVAAGGPLPGLNHHLVASDQVFAYDFVRRDAPSLGSAILAPVAGDVVSASDGMPDRPPSRDPDDPSVAGRELGNHVAIATTHGVIFLCHLQRASIAVRIGDRVEVGQTIGRCGNSGRTTRPHLHVHAQDLPAYALRRASGIPLTFAGPRGPRTLQQWSHVKHAP